VAYPDDADADSGRLCVLTQAGMALLGASPQQTIEWQRPDGAVQRMHVEAVLYQPEDDLRNKLIF
jgi:regulator of nucleoside diphosphate kinase